MNRCLSALSRSPSPIDSEANRRMDTSYQRNSSLAFWFLIHVKSPLSRNEGRAHMTACTPAKVPKGQKVTVKTHLPIPHLSRTNSKCCKALRVLSISHIKLVNLTATADKMPARAKVSDASVSANFGRQKTHCMHGIRCLCGRLLRSAKQAGN